MDYTFLVLTIPSLGGAALVWGFHRLRLSPLPACIMLGILLTPFKHMLFRDDVAVETVAQAGIVLLMFIVGLEFRLDSLRHMLRPCLLGGGLQAVLTAAAAALLLVPMGADPVTAALTSAGLGCGCAADSAAESRRGG